MFPAIGAPIVAILIGVVLKLFLGDVPTVQTGISFTAKRVLQFAVVLLGASLNLTVVWHTGEHSFWVMIGSLTVALIGGMSIGKLFRLLSNIIRLITVGTSICGASAISAVASIISAEEGEIAYAISTIFLFNVVAVFLFPLFIIGFVIMSALDTFHVFGQTGGAVIGHFGEFFVSVALAAIGLNTNLRSLLKTGHKPLLIGLCTWALVAVSSLVIQHFAV